jgi:hypothetical protein
MVACDWIILKRRGSKVCIAVSIHNPAYSGGRFTKLERQLFFSVMSQLSTLTRSSPYL